jgi:hypothetical protein
MDGRRTIRITKRLGIQQTETRMFSLAHNDQRPMRTAAPQLAKCSAVDGLRRQLRHRDLGTEDASHAAPAS